MTFPLRGQYMSILQGLPKVNWVWGEVRGVLYLYPLVAPENMMNMEGNPLGLSTNLEVIQTLGRDMWGHHWNSTPNDWNMAVSCKVSKSNTLLETQWLEVPCSTVGSGGYQPRWGDRCDFFSSAYRDLLLFLMNKAMRLLVRGRTPHQTNLILWNTRSENRNVIMIIMVWYGTKTLFLRTCVPS